MIVTPEPDVVGRVNKVYIRCPTPRAAPLRVTQSNQMKEGGILSPRDRYRLGIIGAIVGLTFLLLPGQGDGSAGQPYVQQSGLRMSNCSVASVKSVGPVAYASGKTTDGAGASNGRYMLAQIDCHRLYHKCTNGCLEAHAFCMKAPAMSATCASNLSNCHQFCRSEEKACEDSQID
jgi:hypothetical protein